MTHHSFLATPPATARTLAGDPQASAVRWGGVWRAALQCEGRQYLTRGSSVGRVLLNNSSSGGGLDMDCIQALGSSSAAAVRLAPHLLPGSMVACAVCSVVQVMSGGGSDMNVARWVAWWDVAQAA